MYKVGNTGTPRSSFNMQKHYKSVVNAIKCVTYVTIIIICPPFCSRRFLLLHGCSNKVLVNVY